MSAVDQKRRQNTPTPRIHKDLRQNSLPEHSPLMRRQEFLGDNGNTNGYGSIGSEEYANGPINGGGRLRREWGSLPDSMSDVEFGDEDPIPHDPIDKPRATVWSTSVNLAMTALGSSILSLPVTIREGGWLGGTLMLMCFAFISDQSAMMLVNSAIAYKVPDLETLMETSYGPRGLLTLRVVLILILFAAYMAIMVIAGDLLVPALVSLLGDTWLGPYVANRFLVMAVVSVVAIPFTMQQTLNASRFVSTAGLVLTIVVAVGFAVKLGVDGPAGSAVHSRPFNGLSEMALILPIHALAYCCHFNVIALRNEMPRKTKHHFRKAVALAMYGLTMPLYVFFSLVAFLLFGSHTRGDVLSGGDQKGYIVFWSQLAFGLVNVLKLPVIALPLRKIFNSTFFWASIDLKHWVNFTEMAGAAAIVFVVATSISSLETLFHIFGSTLGAYVTFIMPGMVYYRAMKHIDNRREQWVALGMISLGIVVLIIGSYSTFIEVLGGHLPSRKHPFRVGNHELEVISPTG
eukprot:Clim_evm97s108 gene=Clim_evmTU97s108